MITLYLDYQVYTYLKNQNDDRYFSGPKGIILKENIKKLDDYLNKNKDHFLIFYSHAHLLDLSQDKSGNIERRNADLNNIEKWADNNYLIYDDKEKKTQYYITEPTKAFEPFEDIDSGLNIDFDEIFNTSEYENLMPKEQLEELNRNITILKDYQMPTLDSLVNEKAQQDLKKFKEIFPFTNGGSFIDMMKGALDFIGKFQKDNTLYRDIRNLVQSGIQKARVNIPVIDEHSNASFIIDLAKIDLSTPDKEKFVREKLLNTVKKQLADRNQDNPSQFELHYQCYFSLDIMGIEPEDSPKTNNMLHDGIHSYYGGHCEIVISNDNKFREKSKLLYKLFGLSTKVYSLDEFLAESFGLELEKINTEDDFRNRLVNDINSSMITSLELRSMFVSAEEIKPAMKYFHYFNQMLMVKQNGNSYLVFRHKATTYLKHLPYKVVQAICNKAYKIFGIDTYGRSEYMWNIENSEISNKQWEGRTWKYGNLRIMLQYFDEHLQMVIGND
ncbi:MAG: hypothetical protein ACK4EY_13365 [Flavipsychrobacter sp.]